MNLSRLAILRLPVLLAAPLLLAGCISFGEDPPPALLTAVQVLATQGQTQHINIKEFLGGLRPSLDPPLDATPLYYFYFFWGAGLASPQLPRNASAATR